MRKILCAAIWFNDEKRYEHGCKNITRGFVITGRRHSDCFMTLNILTGGNRELLKKEKEQGFITSDNFFVNRYSAWLIAKEAGQIIERPDRFKIGVLFSEDLY